MMEVFKGNQSKYIIGITFRSLDQIVIHSCCKIRKIFTTRSSFDDIQMQLPKNMHYPLEIGGELFKIE